MSATLLDIKLWLDTLGQDELSLPVVFRIEDRINGNIVCFDFPLTGAYIDTDTLEGIFHTESQVTKDRNDIN